MNVSIVLNSKRNFKEFQNSKQPPLTH